MDTVKIDSSQTGPQYSRVDHRKNPDSLSGSSDAAKSHSLVANLSNRHTTSDLHNVRVISASSAHPNRSSDPLSITKKHSEKNVRGVNKSDSRSEQHSRFASPEANNSINRWAANTKDHSSHQKGSGMTKNHVSSFTQSSNKGAPSSAHATQWPARSQSKNATPKTLGAQPLANKHTGPNKRLPKKGLAKFKASSRGVSPTKIVQDDDLATLKRRLPHDESGDRLTKRKLENRRAPFCGVLNENIPSDVPWGQIQMKDDPPFEFQAQVGQGTYGKVFKAIEKQTKCQFAMKRLRLDSTKEGFPITTAREMKILQSCAHPNIVRLQEIVVVKSEIYMAMEYVENDLAGLLVNKELELTRSHAKSLMKQILKGVAYLHHNRIIHRDIKGSNVLVTHNGTVKLADFGLAKTVRPEIPNVRYTNRVISLWYRPPELLLGSEHYRYEVDMWSVGCLLVELFTRAPLFFATDEVSQIQAIYNVMGPAKTHNWPERETLPWTPLIDSFMSAHPEPIFRLNGIFAGPKITVACYDLATKLLQMNPGHRITADHALGHEYFQEEPRDERLDCGSNGEWHDWDAKRRLKGENQ